MTEKYKYLESKIKFGEFRNMLKDLEEGWVPAKGSNTFTEIYLTNKDKEILNNYFTYEEEEIKCMDGQYRFFPVSLYKRNPKVSDDEIIDISKFDGFVFTPYSGHDSEVDLIWAYKKWKEEK